LHVVANNNVIPQAPKYLIKNIPDAKALTEIGFEYKSIGKSQSA
jgi:hypothetical protein